LQDGPVGAIRHSKVTLEPGQSYTGCSHAVLLGHGRRC
jgi:hypothetical protein